MYWPSGSREYVVQIITKNRQYGAAEVQGDILAGKKAKISSLGPM